MEATSYTGCHKYVPFARFPNKRKCRGQRIEILTNMTTAMLFFYRKKYRPLGNEVPYFKQILNSDT
jgi:hypothetical protein